MTSISTLDSKSFISESQQKTESSHLLNKLETNTKDPSSHNISQTDMRKSLGQSKIELKLINEIKKDSGINIVENISSPFKATRGQKFKSLLSNLICCCNNYKKNLKNKIKGYDDIRKFIVEKEIIYKCDPILRKIINDANNKSLDVKEIIENWKKNHLSGDKIYSIHKDDERFNNMEGYYQNKEEAKQKIIKHIDEIISDAILKLKDKLSSEGKNILLVENKGVCQKFNISKNKNGTQYFKTTSQENVMLGGTATVTIGKLNFRDDTGEVNEERVACKSFNKKNDKKNKELLDNAKDKYDYLNLYSKTKNTGVVKYFGNDGCNSIFIKSGNVDVHTYIYDYFDDTNKDSKKKKLMDGFRILCSAVESLSNLHDTGFVHLDAKPENMIVTETNIDKITVKWIDIVGMQQNCRLLPGFPNISDLFTDPALFDILKFKNWDEVVRYVGENINLSFLDYYSLSVFFLMLYECIIEKSEKNRNKLKVQNNDGKTFFVPINWEKVKCDYKIKNETKIRTMTYLKSVSIETYNKLCPLKQLIDDYISKKNIDLECILSLMILMLSIEDKAERTKNFEIIRKQIPRLLYQQAKLPNSGVNSNINNNYSKKSSIEEIDDDKNEELIKLNNLIGNFESNLNTKLSNLGTIQENKQVIDYSNNGSKDDDEEKQNVLDDFIRRNDISETDNTNIQKNKTFTEDLTLKGLKNKFVDLKTKEKLLKSLSNNIQLPEIENQIETINILIEQIENIQETKYMENNSNLEYELFKLESLIAEKALPYLQEQAEIVKDLFCEFEKNKNSHLFNATKLNKDIGPDQVQSAYKKLEQMLSLKLVGFFEQNNLENEMKIYRVD